MQNYPQKAKIEDILKEAFSYWNRTLLYQVVFTLVFFSTMFLVFYYAGMRYGILEDWVKATEILRKSPESYLKFIEKMTQKPEYKIFEYIIIFALAFLYPLNLGFYKIFRKLDLKEKISFDDLFSGYLGINFFIFFSYYLFWYFVFKFTSATIILGVVWVFVTLFSAPLMFFMEKRIFESIELTVKALKIYFIEIFVCVLVAIGFKYFGILTVIGGFFTFPFWNAVIYALYKNIFVEKK